MQNNLKLLIVQQFDPETDYSSYDEAELEGAFEATVFQLLQTRNKQVQIPQQTTVLAPIVIETAKTVYQDKLMQTPPAIPQQNYSEQHTEPVNFGAIIHSVIKWNGLDIGCEYKPGEVRFPGRKNSRKLRIGYGHIRGYRDNTGEAPDVYLSPEFFSDGEPSNKMFMVSQLSPEDGDFDEPKYMCGFADMDAAKQAYLREMPSDYFGGIEEVFVPELAKYKKSMDYSEVQEKITSQFTQFEEKLSNLVVELRASVDDGNEINKEFKLKLSEIKDSLNTPLNYTEITEAISSYKEATDAKISELQTEITGLKTVISTGFSENSGLESVLSKIDALSTKVADFISPVQIQGDIIATDEIKQLAVVDRETVAEAVKNWKENVSNYENLLSTGEPEDGNNATV